MHLEALVLFNPGLHFRVFVRGVVVHDQMQLELLGRFAIDFFEIFQPFLMPVLALDETDQACLKIIQRGEQGNGAMADIIVRLRADMPDSQRESGLCALKGLNLAFSSQQSTNALSGGSRYNPITSQNVSSKCGSWEHQSEQWKKQKISLVLFCFVIVLWININQPFVGNPDV